MTSFANVCVNDPCFGGGGGGGDGGGGGGYGGTVVMVVAAVVFIFVSTVKPRFIGSLSDVFLNIQYILRNPCISPLFFC